MKKKTFMIDYKALNCSLLLCNLAPSSFLTPPVEMRQKALLCHQRFQHAEGDHFTLINIFNAYRYAKEGPCE